MPSSSVYRCVGVVGASALRLSPDPRNKVSAECWLLAEGCATRLVVRSRRSGVQLSLSCVGGGNVCGKVFVPNLNGDQLSLSPSGTPGIGKVLNRLFLVIVCSSVEW